MNSASNVSNEDQNPLRYQLSVLIKTLNEAHNIDRTIRSALEAVRGIDAEIIVADSLSTDATVAIASGFQVTVVQLTNAPERCCGVGAQLGYQHSSGSNLLIIDGDMEINPDWLRRALAHLQAHPRLAGVGGLVVDMNLDNIEYRARTMRRVPSMQAGLVDRLYGGGLYRREAIEAVGYFTHRSLHASEELELGLRLATAGWQLERLPFESVRHHGHTAPMWALIRRRWRSRYVDGAGELLRTSAGRPWFGAALHAQKLLLAVLGWWATLIACAGMAINSPQRWPWLLAALLGPPIAMALRKRSLKMGLYAVLAWCVDAAGMSRGLARRPLNPLTPVASQVLHRPTL